MQTCKSINLIIEQFQLEIQFIIDTFNYMVKLKITTRNRKYKKKYRKASVQLPLKSHPLKNKCMDEGRKENWMNRFRKEIG